MLLAEGHLLIEDVPGVGKTMLAKALARSIDCSVRRIQFTPDLLPSDITGVSAYNQEPREFEFKPGPVFANIVVGDEINRASPKTQSALLECMEERQVTVDGHTYDLDAPFMVIATQNPIEMEGTYPLPEAQRDRFTARISMGYPEPAAELEMLDVHGRPSPLDELEPVAHAGEVRELIEAVRGVHVSTAVKQLRHRPGHRHPRRTPTCAWAPPRAPRCSSSAPPARYAALDGPRLRHPRRPAGAGRPRARAPAAARPPRPRSQRRLPEQVVAELVAPRAGARRAALDGAGGDRGPATG